MTAKESADAASRAKSQFLAKMSHEIRTSMNRVPGMTEMLLERELDEAQRRFADTVRTSGEEGPDSPIDRKSLENIRVLQTDGAPDILGEIVGLYPEEAPRLLQKIGEAIDEGDGEAVCKVAHSLKLSSADLGANRLSGGCKVEG